MGHKREADAEADPALVYSSAGVLPTIYSHGVVPVAKTVAAPAVTYSAIPAVSPLVKSVLPTTYSHGVLPTTYSHGVLPTTYSYGVLPTTYSHTVQKREADAEADPALVYSSAGVLPTTYSHGVLPTTYSHGVLPTTYTHGVYSHGVVPVAKTVAAKSPFLMYNPYVPVTHAGVYKAIDQSNVAITPFGATHPSNLGLCFNNKGVQVSC